MNDLNIKIPDNFCLKGWDKQEIRYYKIDLDHLIEFLPKFSLGLAYDLVSERVRVEKLMEDDNLKGVKDVFR